MNQPTHMTIDAKSNCIVVCAKPLGLGGLWPVAREMLGRLLSSPDVRSIQVDRLQARLTIALDSEFLQSGDSSGRVRALAETLRHPAEARFVLSDAYARSVWLDLRKVAEGVSAGAIVSQSPGRVRVRHPLLRRQPDVVRRIEAVLAKVPGVSAVSGSSLTGTVRILFRVGALTPQKLLMAIEKIADGSDTAAASLASPPIGNWIAAGTCLGLAVAAMPVPAVGPVAAAALVCSNLPTLSRGLVELCTFRWKVASLYTVIMGTTLISGQYLAAALMQALVTGWHAWTNHRLRKVVHELSALPESATELRDAILADFIPASERRRLEPGKTIHVSAGTILPVDGIVVGGEAELDEHGVRGIPTPIRRVNGDAVFAGSVVLQGDMRVKVVAAEANTRLSEIRKTVHSLICEAIGNGGATPHGKAVASKFVPFTFATGAAALMVGDIATLAAVLRPDFCTGPSLTDRLGALTGVSHLLHEGWLVRSCEALHALSHVRTIVIHRPSDAALDVSIRHLPSVARPIEIHEVSGSEQDCIDYVEFLTESDSHVAAVANHRVLKQLRSVSVVRISLTPELCLGQPHVDLIALHGQPERLGELLRILQETRLSGHTAWAAILACNGLAISGAFLLGLTNLHVIAITNTGILAAGALHERRVRRSKALLRSHSVQQPLPAAETFVVLPDDGTPVASDIEDPALQPVVVRHGPVRDSSSIVSRPPANGSFAGRANNASLVPAH